MQRWEEHTGVSYQMVHMLQLKSYRNLVSRVRNDSFLKLEELYGLVIPLLWLSKDAAMNMVKDIFFMNLWSMVFWTNG